MAGENPRGISGGARKMRLAQPSAKGYNDKQTVNVINSQEVRNTWTQTLNERT